MFESKAESLPWRVGSWSTRFATALLTNVRLDWLGLQATNALAYLTHSYVRNEMFYGISSWLESYQTFFFFIFDEAE